MTTIPKDSHLLLEQAIAHHQAGDLSIAQKLYQQVLQQDPTHPEAQHLLGLIAHQEGEHQLAQNLIQRAILHDPLHPQFHNNLGNVLKALEDCPGAVQCYQTAIQLQPERAEFYYNLATTFKQMGQIDNAIEYFQMAIEKKPEWITACIHLAELLIVQGDQTGARLQHQHLQAQLPASISLYLELGNACFEAQYFEWAMDYYQLALTLSPDSAEIHFNLGNTLRGLGHFDEAIAHYQLAIRYQPNLLAAWNHLGNTYVAIKMQEEAIDCYQKALQIDPDSAEIRNNLGQLLLKMGQTNSAIVHLKKASDIQPDTPEIWENLGNAYYKKDQMKLATQYYQKSLEIKPDAGIYNNLGNTYIQQGKISSALAYLELAQKLDPSIPEIFNNLAHAYFMRGDLDLAIQNSLWALELKRDVKTASGLLFMLYGRPEFPPEELFAAFQIWVEQYAASLYPSTQPIFENTAIPERRLRVGYISPDFCEHSAAPTFKMLMAYHRPKEVELFLYADIIQSDQATEVFQQLAHHWQNITNMTDQEVFEQIRKDQIDILVDLAGHTLNNRLLVFARKPAPIQFTGLGFGCTTGLATMDYRFADRYQTPPDMVAFNTEKIIYLNSLIRWESPHNLEKPLQKLPLQRHDMVTFGCGNSLFKLNSSVIALWAQILQRIPNSRLHLKTRLFDDSDTCDYLKTKFTAQGIMEDRILLTGSTQHRQHMNYYQDIDIALDPFPYQGGITTCEALWMGVPVVTMNTGSRASVSLLSMMGMSELIAHSPEEYVEIACFLAQRPELLKVYRGSLRNKMQDSAICDGHGFAIEVEDFYRQAWQTWCQQ